MASVDAANTLCNPRQRQVYRTTARLENAERTLAYQKEMTDPVLEILKLWAAEHLEDPAWQSVLNKRTLLHEVEESMVALYYLDQWRRKQHNSTFVGVDVCGGKGIFSLFLQYMGTLNWNEGARLESIILIEKATSKQIDWSHLRSQQKAGGRDLVPVHIWEDCNLHEYDKLFDRFQSTVPKTTPLALTGIHLCKLLSPAMISLVNLLGRSDCCPYVCLAPCCMPRAVTGKYLSTEQRSIPVLGYETSASRIKRRQLIQQKRLLQRKGGKDNGTVCFLCQSPDHWLRQCPEFAKQPSREAQSQLLQAAAAATPCWKCGLVGHFKNDCTATDKIQWDESALSPPVACRLQVESAQQSQDPFWGYCQLLKPALEGEDGGAVVEIVQAELENGNKHRADNWNSRRKSIFLVSYCQ